MSVTVEKDVLEGMAIQDSVEGRRLSRIILVHGLDPTPAETLALRAITALDANGKSLVPEVGDQHETKALENYFVEARTPVAFLNSHTSVKVKIDYVDLTRMAVTHNGNVVREATRLDSQGGRLFALYKAGATSEPADGQPCDIEAPIFRPHDILDFDCFDIGPWANDLQYSMLGAINEDDFQGQPPHTWMCVGINGGEWDTMGRGPIYRRKYSFEYRGQQEHGIRNSWDVLSWWQGPNWPRPPKEINPKAQGFTGGPAPYGGLGGNGWSYDQVQMAQPFMSFKLPNIARVQPRLLRDAILRVDSDGQLFRPS